MSELSLADLNRRIDHAALRSRVDETAIEQLCAEALKYHFYSVAVSPCWIRQVAIFLEGSEISICSVAGFPLGANRTDVKVKEAAEAASDGAHEIDMVANIGWLVSDRVSLAEREIKAVRDALPYNIILKVIIEAGELTQQQQTSATQAIVNAGAQFVKTGTGFLDGATAQQVQTLFRAARGQIEVKAAGGIRTVARCRELLGAGAARLGSSRSVQIMEELRAGENPSI
jgi:deoxyribose-phosphate aldolase